MNNRGRYFDMAAVGRIDPPRAGYWPYPHLLTCCAVCGFEEHDNVTKICADTRSNLAVPTYSSSCYIRKGGN